MIGQQGKYSGCPFIMEVFMADRKDQVKALTDRLLPNDP